MIQEQFYIFKTSLLYEKFFMDTINSTAKISAYLVGNPIQGVALDNLSQSHCAVLFIQLDVKIE